MHRKGEADRAADVEEGEIILDSWLLRCSQPRLKATAPEPGLAASNQRCAARLGRHKGHSGAQFAGYGDNTRLPTMQMSREFVVKEILESGRAAVAVDRSNVL
jgi:hypothetical protein